MDGRATPAQINPNVAYDIGRAGAAWARAFDQVGDAFASLGAKSKAMEDQSWLSEAKIATLESDDAIRRETELNAGPDGAGFEQSPLRLKQSVEEIEKRPGGSTEARAAYKTWAAEQAFENGRWAANTAQKRLRENTSGKLDTRLETLSGLAAANPERAEEYARTYEEEVGSYVGSAIDAADGEERMKAGRERISKEALMTKVRNNPADFGKAVRVLEGASREFTDQNPETRANPLVRARSTGSNIASLSFQLETGKTDPMEGVKNISKDAGGTKSYGNFGINSGGSAQQFQKKYGERFGLTAKPGTAAFDAQWKNAAGAAGSELHAAEMEWWNSTIGSKLTNNLVRVGVSEDMARDPRVQAYFADRSVQYGPGSIGNHADRVQDAFEKAGGDVEKFLKNMSNADRGKMQQDFPTALATGTYSRRGHEGRISGRERGALGLAPTTDGKPVPAHGPSLDPKTLPKVDGTIQPSEIMLLSDENRRTVLRELKPYLDQDLEGKMNEALASLATKGTQNIITEEDINNYEPFIGPKTAAKWREQLRETGMLYHIQKEVINLTPAERQARLSELMPNGNPEDMSEEQLTRFEMYSKAIKAHETAIEKDPLGHLSINNESGRQAMRKVADAPAGEAGLAAREQGFGTMLKLQAQEGVPSWKQRIIGEKEATRMANVLRDSTSPERSVQMIEEARGVYGKYFDQAWGEMVEAGAPTYMLSLTTATREGQDNLIRSIALEKASTESAGKDRANILLEKAGVKKDDLERAVTDRISPFTDSLRTGMFGGDRLIESYRAAVSRVALYHMVTSGKDLSDAVDTAANEIYNKNLVSVGGVNMPTNIAETLGPEVETALDEDKASIISLIDLEKTKNFANVISSKKYGPDYAQRRFIDETKANATFFMNGEGTGVHIRDNDGVPLIDQSGKLITIPWDKLAEVGKQYRIKFARRAGGALSGPRSPQNPR
jgi:hypothetical protein